MPNIRLVAASNVARFTVLLNPGPGDVAATNGSVDPPSKLPAPAPNKSVNFDKLPRFPRLLKLGKPAVNALKLGNLEVKLLRLGKLDARLLRLGKLDARLLRLGMPDDRLLRLGRPAVKLLKLGKFTLPRLLRLVNGFVAPVANCAALPSTLRSVVRDATLGRPGRVGNADVKLLILGKLEVKLLMLGKLLAHDAAAAVPNLLAFVINAPTSAVTPAVNLSTAPLIFCRLPTPGMFTAPDAKVLKFVVAEDNNPPTGELAKAVVIPLTLGSADVKLLKLGKPAVKLLRLGIEKDIPLAALTADRDCNPLWVYTFPTNALTDEAVGGVIVPVAVKLS